MLILRRLNQLESSSWSTSLVGGIPDGAERVELLKSAIQPATESQNQILFLQKQPVSRAVWSRISRAK